MGPLIEQALKDEFDTSSLEKMYQDLVRGNLDLDDEESSNIVIRLTNVAEKFESELSNASRTAKIWLQYLEYISIIRMFIRAERTEIWYGYLEAMRLMLNLFAVTGHINCAKRARLYLQSMQSLDLEHAWLYEQYCKSGYHCIRRTHRYWGELWPDLVIEQCMMRAIKSS